MYCRNCGAEIDDEAAICIHCGVATNNHKTERRESNPLALVGFILSFFVQIAGLICSIIAYRRCKENPNLEGKSMSLAGILISAISIGLALLIAVFWIVIVFVIISNIPDDPNAPGELTKLFSLLLFK